MSLLYKYSTSVGFRTVKELLKRNNGIIVKYSTIKCVNNIVC